MDELITQAKALNLHLTEQEVGKFEVYLQELVRTNEHTNLTAIRTPQEIILKHFVDSLTILQSLPSRAQKIIDIGSGAGFPGIPLKIMRPELDVTLVEATAKKTEFLSRVIKMLSLDRIHVVTGRAEELRQNTDYREQFDTAVARGVAPLQTLVEYALPFLKIGGMFIAQKSVATESEGATDPEIESALQAVKELGGEISNVLPITLPSLNDRRLIIISKVSSTPAQYPRRIGLPYKRPIS